MPAYIRAFFHAAKTGGKSHDFVHVADLSRTKNFKNVVTSEETDNDFARSERPRADLARATTRGATCLLNLMLRSARAAPEAGTQQTDAPTPILCLHQDVLIVQILGKLPDPIDLARVRAMSRAMRDAVAATVREIKEVSEEDAAMLGYLSTLKHLHSRGRLERKEILCAVAARNGQLEVLKWLRGEWVPVGRNDLHACGDARKPRGGRMVTRERVPMERRHVCVRCCGRTPRVATVGAHERVPVGRGYVHGCGEVWTPRVAEVGAGKLGTV